jgi:glyceraldehyde 3-phosphate dehydrogenase
MSTHLINKAMEEAANSRMKGILSIAQDKLVSIDFKTSMFSSIFDPFETHVVGHDFARVLCWYDNEWGFANRMIDASKLFLKVKP